MQLLLRQWLYFFFVYFFSFFSSLFLTYFTNERQWKKKLRYERQEPQRRNKCNVQWTEKKDDNALDFRGKKSYKQQQQQQQRREILFRVHEAQSVVRLSALLRLFFPLWSVCILNDEIAHTQTAVMAKQNPHQMGYIAPLYWRRSIRNGLM